MSRNEDPILDTTTHLLFARGLLCLCFSACKLQNCADRCFYPYTLSNTTRYNRTYNFFPNFAIPMLCVHLLQAFSWKHSNISWNWVAIASSAVKVPSSNPDQFIWSKKLRIRYNCAGTGNDAGVACVQHISSHLWGGRREQLLETACSLFRCPSGKFSHLMRQTTMVGDAFRGKPGRDNWTAHTTPKETGGIHPTNKCVSCWMSEFNYQGAHLL